MSAVNRNRSGWPWPLHSTTTTMAAVNRNKYRTREFVDNIPDICSANWFFSFTKSYFVRWSKAWTFIKSENISTLTKIMDTQNRITLDTLLSYKDVELRAWLWHGGDITEIRDEEGVEYNILFVMILVHIPPQRTWYWKIAEGCFAVQTQDVGYYHMSQRGKELRRL